MDERELDGGADLARLQRFVTEAVRGTTPVGAQPSSAAQAESLIAPSVRGMAPHERLEVYREQFWLRHHKNLDEDFPTLIAILGDGGELSGRAAFRELAAAYLRAYPPRTWDLQRLGADLPAYVARDQRWREDSLAHDAARLDWAFMEAFDAPDSPPFDPRVLASTPEEAWPAAHIELHASLRLLTLAHPVHEVRAALQGGLDVERPAAATTHVVVHRDPACFLRATALEPIAFDLLERLHGGDPLGEACEAVARASQRDPLEIGEKLGGWFQQWTAAGWIRSVRFDAQPVRTSE
jgi:hypothetical protein